MTTSYRVLGDLGVIRDGQELEVTGRQAQVLAALLAAHPDGMSSDRLIEEIWGDQLPADPEATLYSAVSRLRSVVEDDLVKTPSGYRIKASVLDSADYEKMVAEARASASLQAFADADEMWRGDPYRGFDDQPYIRTEVERLHRIHRWATRDRLELMVETGEASAAADELALAVEADPFDEESLALLMRALYRSGRKPQALTAFRIYERLLAEDTGLEPSAHIRELEVAILTDHLDLPESDSTPLVPLDLAITFVPISDDAKIAVGHTRDDKPMLLVHPGWMSKLDLLATGLDMRTPMWAELAHRFRVVMFDRAGTGLSRDLPVATGLDQSVDELLLVMSNSFEEPVPVLAGSAAGPIVAKAAHKRPEMFSQIIFHGTYASGPNTFPPEVAQSLVALVRASWGMGSDVLSSLLFPSGSTEFKNAWSSTQRELTDGETAAVLLEQMYEADAAECLPHIDVPCLITHYREDKAIPIWGAEQLARGLPNARFVPLEGRTHYPMPGAEPMLAGLITDFVAETSLTDV